MKHFSGETVLDFVCSLVKIVNSVLEPLCFCDFTTILLNKGLF